MRIKPIFILILLFCISFNAWCVDARVKQKYPNVLLTDDFGILNENDLASHTWGIKPEPFSVEQVTNYNYWQCFPREQVIIILKDMGYSSEDIGGKENYGDIEIKARLPGHISHTYYMRRRWPIDAYEGTFNDWRKLMKNQKHVCLAGRFSSYEEKKREYDGEIQREYYWVFEKIKTKKGCDSYFKGECNKTYKQFLKESA